MTEPGKNFGVILQLQYTHFTNKGNEKSRFIYTPVPGNPPNVSIQTGIIPQRKPRAKRQTILAGL
jgi:hypothetical protein